MNTKGYVKNLEKKNERAKNNVSDLLLVNNEQGKDNQRVYFEPCVRACE
ncbi:hypothetical protein VCRA2123O444_80118 [Vibrio crassostreae]|nr:hypothetical protein VCRA2117O428_100118 [Vibrio crassostreae]CAK1704227.1 hypothetical protein VCRA2113O416_100119 [Vibrio crassostreae]CAK1971206.1 hypothetical protein VCRA2119O432_20046 [Vibrio crassostreae]CAK1971555.1 hypothetical protein VCRA2114O421_20046 [Vibrio crassostreae]CAK1973631.1 hypothetical protein VCRA2113O409_20046 [Vibrio crassostreae]